MKILQRLKPWRVGGVFFVPVLTFCTAVPGWAAPSAGTILRQTTPPPALPTAPGPVINLPGPKKQVSRAAIKIPVRRIAIKGNALLPAATLAPLVQKLQGRTVTLGELQAAAERITALYHARGYPLAYAYLPAQTIRDGVVRIDVVETRYDRIELQGHSHLKPQQARRTLGLKSGTPITEDALNRGLLLLNQTPGVRVAGTFVPGAKPGTSTLQVRMRNTPRLRLETDLDNQGSDYTGRTRGIANFGLDNPFGYGSCWGMNYLTTEGGLLHAFGLSALSPNLLYGLRAGLYGSHCDYKLGGAFTSLQESGKADQFGLNLGLPVILQPGRVLNARLDLLRNRFRQDSAVTGIDSRSHIDLLRFALSGARAYAGGGSTSVGLTVSRGRLVQDSTGATTGQPGGFWVGQLQAAQNQPLPWGFRLHLGLNAQVASTNLDGSEKFYLGGPYGVMSYPVNEAGGDQGLLLTARLAHVVPFTGPGRLEAALLMQWGEVQIDRDPPAGTTENHRELSGAGIGLDYYLHDWLAVQLSYVHRLGDAPALTGPDHEGELWASLRIAL